MLSSHRHSVSASGTPAVPSSSSAATPHAHHAPAPRRDIAADVSRCLGASPYFSLRNVWCDYHEGVLCLRGRVPSYYLKQVAQSIACQIEGVEECMNRIEVGPGQLPATKVASPAAE